MTKSFILLAFMILSVFIACGDESSNPVADSFDSSSSIVLSSSDELTSSSESSESRDISSSSSNAEPNGSSEKSSSSVRASSSSSALNSSSSALLSCSSSMLSSSSDVRSSSSSVSSSSISSSSSVTLAEPCKTDSTDTCEYGTLTDDRDGKTYKTVKIGDQWWMAENLNFRYLHPTKKLDSTSFCVNDSLENCEKYGRLYMWNVAMDSAGRYGNNGKGCGYNRNCLTGYPVRGVCPEGWHLPTLPEFETLMAAVGGKNKAAKMLKATTGWDDGCSGVDAFGFTALPVGDKYGKYRYEGDMAFFWSSTGSNEDSAWHMSFMYGDNAPHVSDFVKGHAFSVRCLKNN